MLSQPSDRPDRREHGPWRRVNNETSSISLPDQPTSHHAANAHLFMNAWEFEPSKMEFRVTVYELGVEGDELEAAVIKFIGSYGYGSEGNGDAAYMIAIRDYVVGCVLPYALVFDLRELDYEWGNTIWNMFQCDEPFATIVSDRCSKFQTCDAAKPMFDNLEPALEYLRPLAKQYEKSLLD